MTTLHGPVSGIATTSNMAYQLVKQRTESHGKGGGGGRGELESVEYEEVVSFLPPPPLSSAAVDAGGYDVPTIPSPHKYTPLPSQPLASNGGGEEEGKGVGEEEGVYEVLPGEQ